MLGDAVITTNTTINLEEPNRGTQSCFTKVSLGKVNENDPLNQQVIYSQHILADGSSIITINGVPFELPPTVTVSSFWQEMLNPQIVNSEHPNHRPAIILRAIQDFLKEGISGVISFKVLDETSRLLGRETPVSMLEKILVRATQNERSLERLKELANKIKIRDILDIIPGVKDFFTAALGLRNPVPPSDIEMVLADLSGTSGSTVVEFTNEMGLVTRLTELHEAQGGDLSHTFYQATK